jgi:hypothetical protein
MKWRYIKAFLSGFHDVTKWYVMGFAACCSGAGAVSLIYLRYNEAVLFFVVGGLLSGLVLLGNKYLD